MLLIFGLEVGDDLPAGQGGEFFPIVDVSVVRGLGDAETDATATVVKADGPPSRTSATAASITS